MADDPYKVLGVAKDAAADDIRKAYRKLAKEHHPDLHPGDAAAEARFKAVAAAYDLLGDADKRARYDRGEIDASGQERPQQRFYRHYADAGAEHPYHSTEGFADFAEFGDVFSDLFGHARQTGGAGAVRMRGGDARYSLTVAFLDALKGGKQRISLPAGGMLDLTIPAGVRDGQVLRLKGKGMAGIGGGPAGDALVEVHVRPHQLFRREGDDIHIELPISPAEAVRGARIKVPTPDGPVTMTVPKGANSGTRLRLKGKGAAAGAQGRRGDQYVTLKIVLPDQPDDELAALLARWEAEHPFDPRARMGG